MFRFIKNIFQLLLAPASGWEDVSADGNTFDHLLKKGFVPLAIFTALTEFMPLVYSHDATFLGSFIHAVLLGGGLFASVYAARLFLEIVLPKYIDPQINQFKVDNLAIYLVGLDCFYRIFSNLLPATLTFLSFLPLLSLVVLFKSTKYLEIKEEKALNFILLTFVGVVVLPAVICWLLLLVA